MTSDELEYGSTRYLHQPIMLVPLSSGRIAVGHGFNPFELRFICAPEHLAARLEAVANEQRLAYEQRRKAAAVPADLLKDLSFINLGDL